MNRKSLHIVGAVVAAVAVGFAVAAMTPTEAIQQRQKAMEGVRDGMMALGAIAKKEQAFDVEIVKTNAGKVAEHLGQAAGMFPEGSDRGDVETWAKPEIWSDRAQFDETMEKTRQAAVAVQSVTDAEAFPAALGALGSGCKSCHQLYRLPKQ